MKKIITALSFVSIFVGSSNILFAGYFTSTPINTCNVQITRTLQVGSENNDVLILQNTLSRAGYLHATPNGYFGPATKSAVKSFQRDNAISATGQVGEATRNALNERICDNDPRGETLSYSDYNNYYGSYGYYGDTTYVGQYDPYVTVISPTVTAPAIYATPQSVTTSVSSGYAQQITGASLYDTSLPFVNTALPLSSQIQGTTIVNSPSIGYTYNIIPKAGSLTVTSPVANAVYNEGDTIYVRWSTSNLNMAIPEFKILIENTSTNQSKIAAVVSNTNTSIVLTKELLDSVCFGVCDSNQQGSFRIVITVPVTDIAGVTSAFRAAVAPITIKRPSSITSTITATVSHSPVNSGEMFRLFVNTPTVTQGVASIFTDATVSIRAVCSNTVQVNIVGVLCGQELVVPISALSAHQGIPVTATNTIWYKQDISFDVIMKNPSNQILGTTKATVQINAKTFSW